MKTFPHPGVYVEQFIDRGSEICSDLDMLSRLKKACNNQLSFSVENRIVCCGFQNISYVSNEDRYNYYEELTAIIKEPTGYYLVTADKQIDGITFYIDDDFALYLLSKKEDENTQYYRDLLYALEKLIFVPSEKDNFPRASKCFELISLIEK